jgi:hypothetical protein
MSSKRIVGKSCWFTNKSSTEHCVITQSSANDKKDITTYYVRSLSERRKYTFFGK